MILLTGATGFLGQHLVSELLTTGEELRVLVRNEKERDLPWRSVVEVVDGDILDLAAIEQAMEGVDVVVHAAAYVSFWKKNKAKVRQVNIEGTANLVNAALAQEKMPRFLHISSIAAIGRAKKGLNNEETQWKKSDAASTYAISKREAEYEVFRGHAEGLPASILNPGLILGPTNDWENGTGKIFSQVYKGLPFYKKGIAGIIGVKDVAAATSLLIEKDTFTGDRYVLVSENWSYKEMFDFMADALGKKGPSIQISRGLALAGGWAIEAIGNLRGKEPGITVESMRSSNTEDSYDGSKITKLGFAYTPAADVIQEAAKAFLDSQTFVEG